MIGDRLLLAIVPVSGVVGFVALVVTLLGRLP